LYGENTVTVAHGDPVALAGAVGRLLSDPDRCLAMGRLSRITAERFSWRAVAEQYMAVYDRILSSNREPRTPSP
jgi:glycosyltransferase involved in cell wall biosynthesis